LSQTTLRSVLGQVELDDLLSQRERLNQHLQQILDQRTDPWGVKVSAVEVKNVDLPADMQRAIARTSRSRTREAGEDHPRGGGIRSLRETVGGGERDCCRARRDHPPLPQTLTEIAAEKNSTIVFPLPIELLHLLRQITGVEAKGPAGGVGA
jgi:hypothetical protein